MALPEFWVTSVAKYLVGDQPCLLSVWLPGRTYIKKTPRDAAQKAIWNAEHTELMDKYLVTGADFRSREHLWREHRFTLAGRVSRLTGTIDLIGRFYAGTEYWHVVDCKGAQPNDTHVAQVMIYMAALPHIIPAAKGKRVTGEVYYADHTVMISHEQAQAFAPKLWAIMNRLGAPEKPPASPSRSACRFCDIPLELCPDKHVEPPDIETDLF